MKGNDDMNGHELARLRARINVLEGERDALRAELRYLDPTTLRALPSLQAAYDRGREVGRADGVERALYEEATSSLAYAVNERDALRAELVRVRAENVRLRAENVHVQTAAREAYHPEVAQLRTDLARVERAYESASAQAASYRKLRDEGYAQGRADERAALDELASKLGPFAPGVV